MKLWNGNNKVQNKKNEQSRQIEFKLSIPDIQKLKSQAAYAFSWLDRWQISWDF